MLGAEAMKPLHSHSPPSRPPSTLADMPRSPHVCPPESGGSLETPSSTTVTPFLEEPVGELGQSWNGNRATERAQAALATAGDQLEGRTAPGTSKALEHRGGTITLT